MRTCAGVRRLLLYLPLLVTLVSFIPGEALAKGGTNLHEPLPVNPLSVNPLPVVPAVHRAVHRPGQPPFFFGGCGHGRYRVAITHQCRGPADE
jgi:hypothetical protein